MINLAFLRELNGIPDLKRLVAGHCPLSSYIIELNIFHTRAYIVNAGALHVSRAKVKIHLDNAKLLGQKLAVLASSIR